MKIISIESHGIPDNHTGDMLGVIDDLLMDVEELSLVEETSEQLVKDMQALRSIKRGIEEHGITPSIESLFGDTLRSGGISLDSAEVACEGVVDTIKAIARKIWQFIITVVAKVKDFFAKRFGGFQKQAAALKERIKVITAGKKVVKFKKKKDDDASETISKLCVKNASLVAMFSDSSENVDNTDPIKELTLLLDAAKDGEEIDNEIVGTVAYAEWESDRDDDDIYTYTVESSIDDIADTDLPVNDVLGANSSDDAAMASNYNTYLKNALEIAKKFGSGRLYASLDKAYNKIDKKAEKNAKKADYDEEAKNEAANVRNGLAAVNKLIKIKLEWYSLGMATLLAIPMTRKVDDGE